MASYSDRAWRCRLHGLDGAVSTDACSTATVERGDGNDRGQRRAAHLCGQDGQGLGDVDAAAQGIRFPGTESQREQGHLISWPVRLA